MPISTNDLAGPAGSSFKFDKVGDVIEGAIVYLAEPEERVNKFNGRNEKMIRVGIDTGNDEITYIYPVVGTQMAQAIAEALRGAGLGELAEGQRIKVGFTGERDTGKPQPMKLFTARITPATPIDDEEPF